MLRLSPSGNLRFNQSSSFKVHYGGSESNVAISLTRFGHPVSFITRLPDNDIGSRALAELLEMNVDTRHVIYGGDRLGIYYLEHGSVARGSQVVYDRDNSAFACLQEGMIDWEKVLKGAAWFHWSGISPALSQSAANVTLEGVKAARQLGLKVSADLNMRNKLWQYGKKPYEVMPEIVKLCDVLLTDVNTAADMLQVEARCDDYTDDKVVSEQYDRILQKFPNLSAISTTLRLSVNASYHKLSGVLYHDHKLYRARYHDLFSMVDRVGGGDAYMAGLIYGLLHYENDLSKAIEFTVAASVLKHTMAGDCNMATAREVVDLVEGKYVPIVWGLDLVE